MPASSAKTGTGVLIQRATSSGGSYTTVAEVVSVDPFGWAPDKIEVTNLESPNSIKEFIMGNVEVNDMTFLVNLIPSNQTQEDLANDAKSRLIRYFKIVLPTAEVYGPFACGVGFKMEEISTTAPMRARLTLMNTADFTIPA